MAAHLAPIDNLPLTPPHFFPMRSLSRPTLAVVSLAAAAAAPAQHTYEQTYTEVVERLVELPVGLDVDALSAYEQTQLRYTPPRTVAVAAGYDEARGLYEVREVANPRAGLPEWRRRVGARFISERGRAYVLDEDGAFLADNPVGAPDEDQLALEREAAAGRLSPFRAGLLLPDAAALAALRAAGFVVVDGGGTGVARRSSPPAAAARGGVGHTSGSVATTSALTLSDGAVAIAIDTAALIETVTEYAPDGSVASFRATQYVSLALRSGERVLAVGRELTTRPDTLLSGAIVARTTVRTRSNHGYVRDGRDALADATAVAPADLTVFPNPLRARRLSVLLPEGTAGAPHVTLHDATGRAVFARRFGSTEGGLLPVELPADLPAGSYILRVGVGRASWSRPVLVY